MAKQGMKRPEYTKLHPKNEHGPVPILQGKAKSGKEKAKPIVAGTAGADQKVWHSHPYGQFDNDLAFENLTNDIPPEDI
jgi:hypothetical protein